MSKGKTYRVYVIGVPPNGHTKEALSLLIRKADFCTMVSDLPAVLSLNTMFTTTEKALDDVPAGTSFKVVGIEAGRLLSVVKVK